MITNFLLLFLPLGLFAQEIMFGGGVEPDPILIKEEGLEERIYKLSEIEKPPIYLFEDLNNEEIGTLRKKIQYRLAKVNSVIKDKISGKLDLTFVVKKNGEVGNVQILSFRGKGEILTIKQEILEALNTLNGDFKPAIKNKKEVSCWYYNVLVEIDKNTFLNEPLVFNIESIKSSTLNPFNKYSINDLNIKIRNSLVPSFYFDGIKYAQLYFEVKPNGKIVNTSFITHFHNCNECDVEVLKTFKKQRLPKVKSKEKINFKYNAIISLVSNSTSSHGHSSGEKKNKIE